MLDANNIAYKRVRDALGLKCEDVVLIMKLSNHTITARKAENWQRVRHSKVPGLEYEQMTDRQFYAFCAGLLNYKDQFED